MIQKKKQTVSKEQLVRRSFQIADDFSVRFLGLSGVARPPDRVPPPALAGTDSDWCGGPAIGPSAGVQFSGYTG